MGVRAIPRDSQGTYTPPAGTLVNTGDTILVSQHNPSVQDVAQALTNSLDRDGKGGMRNDLQMGGYKISNVAPGVADTDVATVGQLGAESVSVPIGGVIDWWGSTVPDGFLLCYGQAISRTTYANLFAVIGTAAGAGDGSTTFNVPDYRGRVGAGKDDMGGVSAARLNTLASTTLGTAGGAQTHTLSSAEMPSHTHTSSNTNRLVDPPIPIGLSGSGAVMNAITNYNLSGFSVGSTGGGGAHNNIQPTIIANKIIRAL
jgi:microcystin-dependent protein